MKEGNSFFSLCNYCLSIGKMICKWKVWTNKESCFPSESDCIKCKIPLKSHHGTCVKGKVWTVFTWIVPLSCNSHHDLFNLLNFCSFTVAQINILPIIFLFPKNCMNKNIKMALRPPWLDSVFACCYKGYQISWAG